MQQFNSVSNVKFTDADLAKYRSIPLGAITLDPHGVTKIIAALTWMEQQIERTHPVKAALSIEARA